MKINAGPLFWFETVRYSRTRTGHWARLTYCAIFLFILYLIFGHDEITQGQMPRIAEACAQGYVILQYVTVLLLTPVFVASSIIDDRQKRVYEMLLTTHLTADEILIDKLLSRLLHVLIVLASGIPVLALLQVLGGVDMSFVLWHTCVALLLMLTLGCFALRSSMWASSTLTAIMFTWLLLLPGFGFTFVPGYFLGYVFQELTGLSAMLVGMVCWVGFNTWLSIRLLRAATYALESRKPTLLELEKLSHPKRLAVADTLHDEPQRERSSKLSEREVRLRREHFSITITEIGTRPLLWLEANFPPIEWGYWMPVAYLILPGLFALFSASDTFYYFLIKLLLTYYLYMVTLHVAASLAADRFQRRLESAMTLPYERSHFIMERMLGACWRYRHLFFNIVLAFCLMVFMHAPHHWLVFFVYLAQLWLWITLGCWLAFVPISTFAVKLLAGSVIAITAVSGAYCFDLLGVPLLVFAPWVQLVVGLFCPWATWSTIQSYPQQQAMMQPIGSSVVWSMTFFCMNIMLGCFMFWRCTVRSKHVFD